MTENNEHTCDTKIITSQEIYDSRAYMVFYDENGRLLTRQEINIVHIPEVFGLQPDNYLVLDEQQTFKLQVATEKAHFFSQHNIQVMFEDGHLFAVN